jgi:hypothetical protein
VSFKRINAMVMVNLFGKMDANMKEDGFAENSLVQAGTQIIKMAQGDKENGWTESV